MATQTDLDPKKIKKYFTQIQNGSDIRGVAMEGIEGQNVTLNANMAHFIGKALVQYIQEYKKVDAKDIKIAVGTDPRLTRKQISEALASGMLSMGAQVTKMGLSTTPAQFFTTIEEGYQYTASVMATASHLPFNRNGFKFFTSEGSFEKKQITQLLDYAYNYCQEAQLDPIQDSGESLVKQALQEGQSRIKQDNFIDTYTSNLRKNIIEGVKGSSVKDKPLEGLHIVVDAGNGGGGFFTTNVLQPLGANTEGSQFLEPDGKFPNHIPNPENKEAMEAAVQMTVKAKADLGLIFDTDVDRCAVVDEQGKEINQNKMIALISAIVLREHPGTTIVTDSVTSNGLHDFIEGKGGKHLRFRRGYKNVINKGVELNDSGTPCDLMIETSGHGAIKENYFLDDGAYLAVKVLIELAQRRINKEGTISELFNDLKEPLEAKEFRLNIETDEYKPEGDRILEGFKGWIDDLSQKESSWQLEKDNFEGWRIIIDEGDEKKGWVLLRQSVHDPILVLNAESDVEGGVKAHVQKVHDYLNSKDFKLDLSTLQ